MLIKTQHFSNMAEVMHHQVGRYLTDEDIAAVNGTAKWTTKFYTSDCIWKGRTEKLYIKVLTGQAYLQYRQLFRQQITIVVKMINIVLSPAVPYPISSSKAHLLKVITREQVRVDAARQIYLPEPTPQRFSMIPSLYLQAGVVLLNESIHTLTLGKLVEKAARENHTQIVLDLLQLGTISEEARGTALCSCALNGNLELIDALLANGSIPQAQRGRATRYAADRGHLLILRALLANGPIAQEDRSVASRNALDKGHTRALIMLLANGPINQNDREYAVDFAVHQGNTLSLQHILGNGNISIAARSNCVRVAADRGEFQLVQMLLNHGPISLEACTAALRGAVENGFNEIVQILLILGPAISAADRGSAVLYAAGHDDNQMVFDLLLSGPISPKDYYKTFDIAAENGNIEILNLLAQIGRP